MHYQDLIELARKGIEAIKEDSRRGVSSWLGKLPSEKDLQEAKETLAETYDATGGMLNRS